MENIPKPDLTSQLEKIYGKSVVKRIKKQRVNKSNDPIYDFEELRTLLFRLLINNESHPNYYNKNQKHLTRFILITIEKFYGSSSIDFSKPVEDSENFAWEIEHIIPQNSENQNIETIKKENLHNIGNLTLLPYKINGNVGYGNKDFQEKKEYLNLNLIGDKLTINDCFEKNTFGDSEIENRKSELLDKFNKIFYETGKSPSKENFLIENFVRKLGLREV